MKLILILALLPTCVIASEVGFRFVFVPEPPPRVPSYEETRLREEKEAARRAADRIAAERAREAAIARDREAEAAARQKWLEWLRNQPPVDPEKDEYARWLRKKKLIEEFGGPPPDEFEKWRMRQPDKPPKEKEKESKKPVGLLEILKNGCPPAEKKAKTVQEE